MSAGIAELVGGDSGRTKHEAIYRKFQTFTMIPGDVYVANLELVHRFASVRGSVVECGTWKGGMIAGIAELVGGDRRYLLFDSFQGLPPAQTIDGPAALSWQCDTTSPRYFDNCTASEEDARRAMELAGVPAAIKKGWFRDTLPVTPFHEGIAVLRLDADWYDSTMEVLNNLFRRVVEGGVVIVDDYYTWDGCSKAVHDYLSQNRCAERIQTYKGVCFLVKR